MKLTLKIKLLPDNKQAKSLLQTIKEANSACNTIFRIASGLKIFNQFKIHKEVYHKIRGSSKLSAQIWVRCISTGKVCFHVGERNGKRFNCKNCGKVADADQNAAKNIARWGYIINQPEKSSMFSCALHS